MSFQTLHLTKGDISQIFNIQEDHFNDFKAKGLNGKQFSKAVSAFANASGGEIYIGIREETASKVKHWEGFGCPEDANSFIQILGGFRLSKNTTMRSFYCIQNSKHMC